MSTDAAHDADADYQVAASPPTSTAAEEIAVEQRHVDIVYARLDELRDSAAARQRAGYEHRKATVPGAQFERDVFVYEASRRIADIDSQHEGLVFGRLDLDGGKVRHIGRLGLRDAQYRPLLIDWRAPAAAPFYQATPADRQSVTRRRVIRCSGRRVLEVSDDLLDVDAEQLPVIGDGALMAALTRKRTGRMRDIVATIQAEQDAAIRAPGSGATIISGGPGTGKTVVALHRAAYLLYNDRRRYEGAGILVVGPSPVFMRYIERVLPSLGEETVALYALGELFPGVSATRADSAEVAAIKGGLRMRKVLSRAIRQRPVDAPRHLTITYAGEVFKLSARELAQARAAVHNKDLKPNAAKTEAGRALLVAIWRKAKPVLPDLVPAEFSRTLGGRSEFLSFLDEWWPLLTPEAVLRSLADPQRLASAAAGALSDAEVAAVAGSLADARFAVSDVPLLDELSGMLGSPPKPRQSGDSFQIVDGVQELTTIQDRLFTRGARPVRDADYDGYAHVIVDEAQDLSPMQWRMLGRRGRQASWTIVGDAAQSSWPDAAEAGRARRATISRGRPHSFHLTTNYRNSAEIFDHAAEYIRAVVPDADIPEAVRHTGREPERRHTTGDGVPDAARTAALDALKEVDGAVGVIAVLDRHAELIASLPDDGRVHLVTPLESKGLEYDAVLIVDFDQIVRESGSRVGYVALTRATQLLIQIDVDVDSTR